ncbi:Rieske 2Fe-2S domain-containing protein, partial [Candidatus Gracilibacteria bacterium]|nr:Rieske 2Fe-2S domain-containing protein [Candidatus Gracilibacteria bacterium]
MHTKLLIGPSHTFVEGKGKSVMIDGKTVAVFRKDGQLFCIGGRCMHAGGPLYEGEVVDGKVICPWHQWDWDLKTGKGWGEESVGSYRVWEEDDQVYLNFAEPLVPSYEAMAHEPMTIEPKVFADNKIRILGISTTMMNLKAPRPSTSEYVLTEALATFSDESQFETKVIKLRDLKLDTCEGYYSKDKAACIWPCSITQAREDDQMVDIYRGLVEWAD